MSDRGPGSRERRSSGRRRRVPAPSRGSEIAGIALLGLAIAGSALLFGAQQTPVLVVTALLSAGAALLLGLSTTPKLVWLLFGLAAYTLLQIVPLPLGLVARLSPASAAVWRDVLRPFGAPPPGWATLSVDPAATALETLKWFAYACVFVAASGLRARRGPAWVAMLVVGSSFLVCGVTLVHGILDIRRIYGLYAAPDPSQWLRGPFVNGNNLAGYLNVGLFAGVGLLLSPDTKLPRWPLLLAVPLLGVELVLTGSRGGVGALGVVGVAMGLIVLRQRRMASRRVLAGVAASALLVVVAAFALGGPRLAQAFADRDMRAKVAAWKWSLDMIGDFPVFGVGRGAFETAFQPYRGLLGRDWTMVFPYAENFPLQWAADWGPVVAIAGLVLWILLVRRALARALRDPLTTGLVAGIAALLLQNLVDLGLELFAVSALALLALGGALEPRSETRSRLPSGLLPALGVVISSVIVAATGAELVRIERHDVERAYSVWIKEGAEKPRAFLAQMRKVMLRHPGEAYFPLVASVAAARAGEDPLRFIGRALERSPLDGQVHLRLADVLAERKVVAQALMHLRLAALYDVILRDLALRKAANLVRSADELARAFPRDLPGGSLLSEVCRRALGPVRVGCFREVVERDVTDHASKVELASALLDAVEAPAPPCVGESAAACSAEISRRVAEVETVPNDWRVRELRARELAVRGEYRPAANLLLEHCPSGNEAIACAQRAVEIASRSKDLGLLGSAADRYVAAACVEATRCASAHERLATIYTGLGAFGLALKHASTAAKEDPSIERWIQSAEAAGRAGSAISAHMAFDRARHEGELSPAQLGRIEAVEAMLAAQMAPK